MDRNGGKTCLAWYDGNFMPVTDDRVWTNEKYLNKKAHERPADWESLLHLARRASVATPAPFASFDMYSSTRGPLLGEVTLVPGGFYFGKYFSPRWSRTSSWVRCGNERSSASAAESTPRT